MIVVFFRLKAEPTGKGRFPLDTSIRLGEDVLRAIGHRAR